MFLKKLNKKYFNKNLNLVPIILIILLSRFIPHPPNFTPIISIAILCPLFFKKTNTSLILVIGGMFVTDLFLGLYQNMIATYLVITLIYFFSKFYLKTQILNLKNLFLVSIFSASIFFFLTNLTVWAFGELYPLNFGGLILCYVMAIPFFTNTLISTILFSGLAYTSIFFIDKKKIQEF